VLFGDADRRRLRGLISSGYGSIFPIIPPSLAKGFQIEILAKTELALADERKWRPGSP